MFMTNLTVSRIDSVNIKSTIAAESPSSSSDGIYSHSELPSLAPHFKLSEESNHFLNGRSITSPLPGKVTPTMKFTEKNLVLNVQGHLNIYSSFKCGSFKAVSRQLTPRGVAQHNSLVGWNELYIYKGKIYENIKLREVFSLIVAAGKKENEQPEGKNETDKKEEIGEYGKNGDNDFNASYSDYSDFIDSSISEVNLDNMALWNGIQLLLKSGFDKTTIENHIQSCCVGIIVQSTDVRYWSDLRKDVQTVLNDLIGEDCQGTLSLHKADYMHLLQRWINKYRYQDPENSPCHEGDPNQSNFPLPQDIDDTPECLRSWIEAWERFDFDIPEHGAWTITDVESTDLANSHEIFLNTLKSHVDLSPLDTSVNGEAAWEVIPGDLFANDVMTDEQKVIERRRKNIANFFDPQRMERKRQFILQYFINKYRYDITKVTHFLNWAACMKEGEEQFIKLCDNS